MVIGEKMRSWGASKNRGSLLGQNMVTLSIYISAHEHCSIFSRRINVLSQSNIKGKKFQVFPIQGEGVMAPQKRKFEPREKVENLAKSNFRPNSVSAGLLCYTIVTESTF